MKRQVSIKTRIARTAISKGMQGKQPKLDTSLIAPDRTPCPRCAVRADIGCAHQPRTAS